jgi:4-amino-4-deoxy-L-arabinose transferase-like glycosyltransferase
VTGYQRYVILLCLLAGLLYFPALGSRDFWAPVEPRYAEIVRVMFAKNEWIVPTVNGDLYTDKPILYFWLVLVASKLVGAVNEWTVRLPPALAGVGLVLVTYAIGRDFFSPRVGFIAGAVLATTVRVIWEARWAHTDMVFSLFFALSLYFAARSLLHRGHSKEILFSYLFMALATLSKGLIGVVLPALILVSFTLAQREWGYLRVARLPLGIAIFLLIATPWFLLVNSATDGKWLSDFVYVHHLQRYTAGAGHRQPFYYYLQSLPADFLPWTIFALPALLAYRPYRNVWHQPITLFFVLWFGVIFLFFSLSDTKRDLYLLPAFPAVALFVASYIDDLISGVLPQSLFYRTVASSFFHLLWLSAMAVPIVAWLFQRDAVWIGLPSVCMLVVGGLAGVYFIRRREPKKLMNSTVVMMLLTVLTGAFFILPYLEQYKSRRPFSLEIKNRVVASAPLYIYGDGMHDFNYYSEREVIPIITSKGEVEKLLLQDSTGYILVKERDLKRLNVNLKDRIVAMDDVGSTTWNLISLEKLPSPESHLRN